MAPSASFQLQIANSETSGPSRYSSITTRVARTPRVGQRLVAVTSVTTTPLPAASPSSLTTYGAPSSSSAAAASSAVVQTKARAVGTPAAAITSLANALDPSSRAAAPEGPKHRDAGRAHRVGDAGDQRRLGPDDDQVDAERGRQRGHRAAVERVDVVQRRDAAMPGLPGAACTSVTAGSGASARASACSRPPVPMTRVFTASMRRATDSE